jgi:hypothetical protein
MDESLLTMSAADIREYGAIHGYPQMMFGGSADDYIASRCLILNILFFSGFPLFSQSVEKMLKAYIHLETGRPTTLRGPDRHNPYLLKEELQGHKDYGLSQFDAILKKLYGHFQQRYHDNPDKSNGMGGNELDGFDELWMYLFDAVPFPVQIKYRLTFTHRMFESKSFTPQYSLWATLANKAMAPKLKEMEEAHFAVEKHYIESSQQLSKPQA